MSSHTISIMPLKFGYGLSVEDINIPDDAQMVGCYVKYASLYVELFQPANQTIKYVNRRFFVWPQGSQVNLDCPERTMESDWTFKMIGQVVPYSDGQVYNVAYLEGCQL